MKSKKSLHYAWIILLAAAVIRGISGPSLNGSSGLFLTPVSQDIGVGIGTLSIYLSIASVINLIWLPIAGGLFKKLSVRKIALAGSLLQAIPFALLGLMYRVWGWYLLSVPLAMGSVLLVNLLGPVLINRWFAARQGLIMGCLMTLTSLIGALLQPLLAYLIAVRGWRSAYTVFGILALAVLITVSSLFLKDEPATLGQAPCFHDEAAAGNKTGGAVLSGIVASHALRSVSFYMLLLYMVVLTGFTALSQHISPFGLSTGLSVTSIGTAMSVSMIGAASGSILIGYLCDKAGAVFTGISVMLCGMASVLLFLFAARGFVLFVCAAFLHGFASSAIGVIAPVLTRSFFGERDYERLFSLVMTGSPIAAIILMPAYGFVYDALGSYTPIFLFLLVFLAAGILFLVIAAKIENRKKP